MAAKKNLRRNDQEGYEFKDGRNYGCYKVYDDGRVEIPNPATYDTLQTDLTALDQFRAWVMDYMMKQQRELQKRIADFWRTMEKELQIVCPVENPEDFDLQFDPRTRIVTRKKKPEPEKPTVDTDEKPAQTKG
jgi:deoxyribodipyrimidine photolyase-like uncharacterized protein